MNFVLEYPDMLLIPSRRQMTCKTTVVYLHIEGIVAHWSAELHIHSLCDAGVRS